MKIRAIKALSLTIGILAGCSVLGLTAIGSVTAQDSPTTAEAQISTIEGDYAGTFICGFGEMGMALSVSVTGPADIKLLGQTCRSGAGRCNDAQNARLASMRSIGGVLNFFPTASNPDAPSGAFKVNGSAEVGVRGITKINLQPGDWIDQPTDFGSSPMTATVRNGKMVGKPTAPGCYTLRMQKLAGV